MNSPTKDKETLKPCPFCGSASTIELGNPYAEDFRFQCTDCKTVSGRYRTREEAIKAWNTRATESARAEGTKDTERLNWLEKHYSPFEHRIFGGTKSPRAMIDAVISAERKPLNEVS